MIREFLRQIIVEALRSALIDGLFRRVRGLSLRKRPKGILEARRSVYAACRKRLFHRLATGKRPDP